MTDKKWLGVLADMARKLEKYLARLDGSMGGQTTFHAQQLHAAYLVAKKLKIVLYDLEDCTYDPEASEHARRVLQVKEALAEAQRLEQRTLPLKGGYRHE